MRFSVVLLVFSLLVNVQSVFMPVYIALRQYNLDILRDMLKRVSDPLHKDYGMYYSRDMISSIVDPPRMEQQRVVDWLVSNDVGTIENYGDMIKIIDADYKIDEIFKTHLSSNPRSSQYEIPYHLRDIIDYVELDSNSIPTKIPQISRTIPSNDVDNRFLGREMINKLYNITDDNVDHTVIGVLTEFQNNGGFSNADMFAQQALNLQQNNGVYHITGLNYGLDAESVLDVQIMSNSGNNMDLWFWNTPYWMYSFAADYYNAENIGNIVSMSWGWAQDSQCDIVNCVNITSQDYVERVNNEFLKISLRGVTILAASGDAGAPGRTNEGCEIDRAINPVFPGSSPYITSVGATYVPQESSVMNFTSPLCQKYGCITSTDERAISFEKTTWTTGGGFDLYEKKTPWWQNKSVSHYLHSGVKLPEDKLYNKNGRAYPDVSAIGHNCPICMGGNLGGIDGTSCSSPLVGGLLSYVAKHLWERYNKTLGFANPLLYSLHEKCDTCFRDVVHGHNWCTEETCCDNPTNFGFNTTTGYDPVSGLGTPNVGEILRHLESMFGTH